MAALGPWALSLGDSQTGKQGATDAGPPASHPVHGQVDPQGVVQLVQKFHKALFLSGRLEGRSGEAGPGGLVMSLNVAG